MSAVPAWTTIARCRAGPQTSSAACSSLRGWARRACMRSSHCGLRVSGAATGADIEHLGLERGHRTLVITCKGGKVVTIALAPRTARAIDLAVGERADGSVFTASGGRRLDRHGAARVVRRVARRAGIGKKVGPHTLRHAFITASLMPGLAARRAEAASRADPRATMRYDRARGSLDRHATCIVAAYLAGVAWCLGLEFLWCGNAVWGGAFPEERHR